MAKAKIYSVLISRPHEDAEIAVSASSFEMARNFLHNEVIDFYYSMLDGNDDEEMFENGEDYFKKGINQFGDEFIDEYFTDMTRFYIQINDLW